MTIFERVKALNFPSGQYVVVGGAMEAHGIRPAGDADIVVVPELFEKLKKDGWRQCGCEYCQVPGAQKILKGDGVDILSHFGWFDKYHSDTDTLIIEADIVQGIPFVKLNELLKFKIAYNEGYHAESKHGKDIEFLREHIKICKCFSK